MAVNRELLLLLKQAEAIGNKPAYEQSPTEVRARIDSLRSSTQRDTCARAGSDDYLILGSETKIPVRVYRPFQAEGLAVFVFFHGGGFVSGSIETYESVCRELSIQVGCLVVSVNYRLAPEHKFPAAYDDCLTVVRWVAEHAAALGADGSRIAVGGDSAGGNIAAAVAQTIRDTEGPALIGQLLIYPLIRMLGPPTTSMVSNAWGFGLTAKDVEWSIGHYLRSPTDASNVRASPGLAKNLSNLPRGLVITAEYDPLRDEGEAYAIGLRSAGVETRLVRYEGAIHGFWSFFSTVELSRRAFRDSASWLKEVFQ